MDLQGGQDARGPPAGMLLAQRANQRLERWGERTERAGWGPANPGYPLDLPALRSAAAPLAHGPGGTLQCDRNRGIRLTGDRSMLDRHALLKGDPMSAMCHSCLLAVSGTTR